MFRSAQGGDEFAARKIVWLSRAAIRVGKTRTKYPGGCTSLDFFSSMASICGRAHHTEEQSGYGKPVSLITW